MLLRAKYWMSTVLMNIYWKCFIGMDPNASPWPQLPQQQAQTDGNWYPPPQQWQNRGWVSRGRRGWRGRGWAPNWRGRNRSRGRNRGRSQSRNRRSQSRGSSRSGFGGRRRGHPDDWYLGKRKNKETFGWVTKHDDGTEGRHNIRNPWNWHPDDVKGEKFKSWRFPADTKVSDMFFTNEGNGKTRACFCLCVSIGPPSGRAIRWDRDKDKPVEQVQRKLKDLKVSDDDKGGLKKRKWRSLGSLFQ